MKLFRLAVVAGLLLMSATAFGQDAAWFRVSSPNFLLYTDTTEAKGERLLTDFEKRVDGFEAAFGTLRPRQFPIEVFLFKDHTDYLTAMPKQPLVNGVAPAEKNGYLVTGPDRVFIIAKDKSPEDISNDVGHALGHVLFEHQVMWRPFWLNEAAAEYVRKLGRNPDIKPVSEKDAFAVDDLLTIVPSATYQDSDPGGAFRVQSFRLLQWMLKNKPDALPKLLTLLGREDGRDAKPDLATDAVEKDLSAYVETSVPMPPTDPALRSGSADLAEVNVHRGDLMLAMDKGSDAAKYYNANSSEARAARAILTRFTRSLAEAIPALSSAAQDLQDNGLVQYHFGALNIEQGKELPNQRAALERAVKLLPDFGRAYAELARLYALTGDANKSMPLIAKALELAPEYADHTYEIRAGVLMALSRYEDAFASIQLAEVLPHTDRKTLEAFSNKVETVRKQIENARRANDRKEVDRLRQQVEAQVNEREPVKPPPPEVRIPDGTINYQIAATLTLDVDNAVYPEYPETLRKQGKSGKINLRVEIAPDGKVKSATITSSQFPEMNADTVEAVKQWMFKLPPRTRTTPVAITIAFTYALK